MVRILSKEVQLRVAKAKPRDVARANARIDEEGMAELGVSTGDVVEITGKKKTVAVVWPAYPEDQGMGIVRIDGTVRQNAGMAINDYVKVKKAEVRDANAVTIAPAATEISVDVDFAAFIKDRLIDRPLLKGDTTLVMMLGRSVPFVVAKTIPIGIVRVVPETRVEVLPRPIPKMARLYRTTYEDIGGLHEEIQRIREMVELPMRHPELFSRLGIEPPKGLLLHGPPGCGKTLLARAVANESEANFIAINGPEIMGKFYGESEKRLREIFEEGERKAPSIVFIDEIDAIAPKRGEVTGEVERRVVAQLLALMDGLEARENVIVIGATNRPNALDPALRRPGRFDREIEIGIPDRRARLEILQIHTRGVPLAKDVDLKKLSSTTHGYTGADIAALSREAAMKALRRYLPEIDLEKPIPPSVLNKMQVEMRDFIEAYKAVTPTAMREVYIEVPNVPWSDVGGLKEVKQLLREVVEWPLKKAEMFKRMGIKPPRGILLYGPPGCGKTLLARAVATESEANFISIKGPEVFSKWVGESEKAIREVFRKGKMAAPSIIFFDEFDALVPRRGLGYGDGRVTERVISQLLTEVDGMIMLEDVVVIAATNRPDIIDPAVLRPGRFDRLIFVPAPDKRARVEIFKVHTKGMPLASDVSIEKLADTAEGYSGADIATVCREAGMSALRRDTNAKQVELKDFESAMERIPPSVTPKVNEWYDEFSKRSKRIVRPIPEAIA